jgi:hypothetical protein
MFRTPSDGALPAGSTVFPFVKHRDYFNVRNPKTNPLKKCVNDNQPGDQQASRFELIARLPIAHDPFF